MPGTVLLLVGVVFGAEYYSEKDKRLVLEAQLRRARIEASSASGKGANTKEARLEYRASLPDNVEAYRLHARKLRRLHNFLQVTVIMGSLSASALITLGRSFQWISYLAIVNTLAIGAAATTSTYFKFKERSLSSQTAADALETELRAAELRISFYSTGSSDEVLEQLLTAVERYERSIVNRSGSWTKRQM